jgi:hypothetical protein
MKGKVRNMARYILLLVFLLSGCLHQAVMTQEQMVIRKELIVDDLSRTRMFDQSEAWIIGHLSSDESVIRYANRDAGVIVARATMDYPALGKLDAIAMIQYTVSFTMRVETGARGIVVTFSDLVLNVPKNYRISRYQPWWEYTGGYSVPVSQRSHFEAIKKGLLDLADGLGSHLRPNLP